MTARSAAGCHRLEAHHVFRVATAADRNALDGAAESQRGAAAGLELHDQEVGKIGGGAQVGVSGESLVEDPLVAVQRDADESVARDVVVTVVLIDQDGWG